MSTYNLRAATVPRLSGAMLKLVVALLENALARRLVIPKLMKDGGLTAFRQQHFEEPPSVLPVLPRLATVDSSTPAAIDLEAIPAATSQPGFPFESVADYQDAYRSGRASPETVATKLLEAVRAQDALSPRMRAVVACRTDDVLAQAEASSERWKNGRPLGPLDGVPAGIKDELDVAGYRTTAGTAFLSSVAATDASAVARLRAAGALIYGKLNMHEIGIDITGFNRHFGTPRNPYDPGRYTGGSSSGSGAAVAAGLGPIAIGADGGGSIRIPASLCGVVGLKATWSRISEGGAFPLCWSVGHVGPLGATVRDVALAYAVIAGPDARDRNTLSQPPVRLDGLGRSLDGLRIGVFRPWFEDADGEIVETCDRVVRGLGAKGARLVDVELPDLEACRMAHAVTFLSEVGLSMDPFAAHLKTQGLGVRANLALARAFTSRDFVRAQQVRTRMLGHLARVFADCDVLVTPTTGRTAPEILPDAFETGESDLDETSAMMRFIFVTNLTGHPSLSFPAGYDSRGLPIGLQVIGRHWEEHVVLRLALAAEPLVERRAPRIHARLLM